MCGPTIFDPFRYFRHLLSGASAEYWAQHGCRPKSHCDSVISVIQQTTLAPRVIRDMADDTCVLKCLALWVMYKRGEVNGMQVCKYGNPMGHEGSE